MVVATAAATLVGFWLSYDGLHAFALHAGLRGAEAWAWPGSGHPPNFRNQPGVSDDRQMS